MPVKITITHCLNGWLVEAGCQTLAYTDAGTLTGDLRQWLTDPVEVEKRVLATSQNRKITHRGPEMPPPCGLESVRDGAAFRAESMRNAVQAYAVNEIKTV